ncbi:MAG: response regulator [Rhodobacteraceae bacterium]|nr:response regulator [Paracoccaceae bacterium]
MNNPAHSDAATGSTKVLFVDDEVNVLNAIQRQLRKGFQLITASNGDDAIKIAAQTKDLAVVVCDKRMPGKNGVETLAAIEKCNPDAVRIMLTGNADQETAISAINHGKIFRFLNKPCPEETLRAALHDAVRQYELVTAEKALLNQTLTGSVKMMIEVLGVVAPDAFGRANRARGWVKSIAQQLNLQSRWEIEMGVMLAPLGMVAVPPEVLVKAYNAPQDLSPTEQDMLAKVPETGHKLIANIPRLKNVAEIIRCQDMAYAGPNGPEIPLGARIAKLLKDLAAECTSGQPTAAAVAKLSQNGGKYDPDLMGLAQLLWGGKGQSVPVAGDAPQPQAEHEEEEAPLPEGHQRRKVTLDGVLPDDLLLTPISFVSGKLLLDAGMRVTGIQIERLRNLRKMEPIAEPFEIARVTAAAAA